MHLPSQREREREGDDSTHEKGCRMHKHEMYGGWWCSADLEVQEIVVPKQASVFLLERE